MRTALLADGVWVLLAGIALLFPPVAAVVFAYPTKDVAVTSGWGAALLVIGVVALVMAGDVDRYGRMVWVIIAGLLLTVVDVLYSWLTGACTLRTALPPIVINVMLAGNSTIP